jgi:hypothetical protein
MVGNCEKMTMGLYRKKKKKKNNNVVKPTLALCFFLKLNEFLCFAMEPLTRCFYGSKIIQKKLIRVSMPITKQWLVID